MSRIQLVLLVVLVMLFPWRLASLTASVFLARPGLVHVSEDESHYWDAQQMEARLDDLGWKVVYDPTLRARNMYGLTVPQTHTIYIDEHLHWTWRYAVLAHEGAHVIQPAWMDEAEGEVFAECVSTLVAGFEVEHASYLAHRKLTFLEVMLVEHDAMYAAANVLTIR